MGLPKMLLHSNRNNQQDEKTTYRMGENIFKVEVLAAQLCSTFCNPVDCNLPSFSIHGILQARILDWVAISFSRGSSWPRNQTWISSIADRFFTDWDMREAFTWLKISLIFSHLLCSLKPGWRALLHCILVLPVKLRW